jgi:hypothetical protein
VVAVVVVVVEVGALVLGTSAKTEISVAVEEEGVVMEGWGEGGEVELVQTQ